jgi:hypothetical protein
MATTFSRIEIYLKSSRKQEVTDNDRKDIGSKVISAYFQKKPPQAVVHHLKFTNDKGSFRVVDYPKWFIPEIDEIITAHFPPIKKRLRKRIPSKIQY